MPETLHHRVVALIAALGLGRARDVRAVLPLTGGVASDIARVDVGGCSYCVKFALPQLRVAADWFAPVHRSRAEYRWLKVAGQVAPGAAPKLYGFSADLNGFAMEFISGPDVRLWKTQLLSGAPPEDAAGRVADVVGRIHAMASHPSFDRTPFLNAADFHALRVEPYLLYTATRHPAIAARLADLAGALDRSSVTLVHGDVSPKNILLRGDAPVLLDAECATMGDPAFDVAFCMNHLILKACHLPQRRADLLQAARAFWCAYAPHVVWEHADAVEVRVAALVPALMLARVDGKSPVEYLTETARAKVRAMAIALVANPVGRVGALLDTITTGAGT